MSKSTLLHRLFFTDNSKVTDTYGNEYKTDCITLSWFGYNFPYIVMGSYSALVFALAATVN